MPSVLPIRDLRLLWSRPFRANRWREPGELGGPRMSTANDRATAPMDGAGLDTETLDLMLEALSDFVGAALPDSRQLELDHEDVCPEDLVRAMCGDELGVQLL